MGFTFPDAEAVLFERIQSAGGDVELHQSATFASRVTASNPVHHVYALGGSESGPFRTDRIDVDTYGDGRDAARDAAEDLRLLLTAGPVFVPGVGLIDHVAVDVPPRGIPYADDRVTLVKTTYRADTRAI